MDRTTRYASFVERPTNMTGRPCVGPAAWLRQIPDTNLPLGNNLRPIAEERSRSIPRGASSASGKPSLARVFKASSQSKRFHLGDRKFDSPTIHATTPYVRDSTLYFRFIDIQLLFGSESASIGLFRALSLGLTPLVRAIAY